MFAFFPSDFIVGCAFFLHFSSLSLQLFCHYYYHLNINVVGYNSVGFIILCTEWTAHIGHSYLIRSYITYECMWMSMLASCSFSFSVAASCCCCVEPFSLYWLALEIGERLFRWCMLVHIQSNYCSNKNTGNISEKSEIKKHTHSGSLAAVCSFLSLCPSHFFALVFVWECQSRFFLFAALCPSNPLSHSLHFNAVIPIISVSAFYSRLKRWMWVFGATKSSDIVKPAEWMKDFTNCKNIHLIFHSVALLFIFASVVIVVAALFVSHILRLFVLHAYEIGTCFFVERWFS